MTTVTESKSTAQTSVVATTPSNPADVKAFLAANADVEMVELIFADVNGVARGKWATPEALHKLFSGDFRLPRSCYVTDIWGETSQGTGLGMKAGDADSLCVPVPSSLSRVNWLNRPAAQCLMSMNDHDGEPFAVDPRTVLKQVLSRYHAANLRPVIALELEFYLLDQTVQANGHPNLPMQPGGGRAYSETQILDVLQMQDFEAVFAEIQQACDVQGIPADTAIKEEAPSQFEINLLHHDDALLAADQLFLLKRLIKGCAQKHGLMATFMAKPFSEHAGNGLHMHASVIDEAGENIFHNPDNAPQGAYAHAIGGLLEHSPDLLAFFAPHANSYRRFGDINTLSPNTLSWGNENRTTLVRLPMANAAATRVEYRLAGADANPYLVVAAILAAMHAGMDKQTALPPETLGNANDQHPPILSMAWAEAVGKAVSSAMVADYFGEQFLHCFQAIKQGEMQRFQTTITDFEYHSYLRHV